MQAAQNIVGLCLIQEPAAIEPGTLITGVSKEGISHHCQLFQQSLWAGVWLRVQLGQEAGAIMSGGIFGEVSGDEAAQ